MPIKHNASDFLKKPEDIAAYLNATIEEMDDPRLLMKAFRNVAEAQGGVSELARRAEIDRVALSRTLSGRRNPRLDTLAKVAEAVASNFSFLPSESPRVCPRLFREGYVNVSTEVTRLAVTMYISNPLSLRQVEDIPFERGIGICHVTI